MAKMCYFWCDLAYEAVKAIRPSCRSRSRGLSKVNEAWNAMVALDTGDVNSAGVGASYVDRWLVLLRSSVLQLSVTQKGRRGSRVALALAFA